MGFINNHSPSSVLCIVLFTHLPSSSFPPILHSSTQSSFPSNIAMNSNHQRFFLSFLLLFFLFFFSFISNPTMYARQNPHPPPSPHPNYSMQPSHIFTAVQSIQPPSNPFLWRPVTVRFTKIETETKPSEIFLFFTRLVELRSGLKYLSRRQCGRDDLALSTVVRYREHQSRI